MAMCGGLLGVTDINLNHHPCSEFLLIVSLFRVALRLNQILAFQAYQSSFCTPL